MSKPLSWLENLQKAEPLPRPEPAAKIDEFADLFKTDADVAVDGGVDILSAPEQLVKALENQKFNLREPEAASDTLEKSAPREKLFSIDPPSTDGFVSEDIGKILGLKDMEEALQK
jgi:hypothetical protein